MNHQLGEKGVSPLTVMPALMMITENEPFHTEQ